MATLYKYAFYCSTESITKNVWRTESDSLPSKCPDDTSHTIDSNSIRIIEKREQNKVIVQEESVPTGGHFRTETVVINAEPNSTTTIDKTWDKNISVLEVYFVSTSAHEGDTIDLNVAPDTIIGTITSDVSVSDTVINVSQTVIDNTEIGYYITLTDGVNTNLLGEVINIDKDNLQITCKTPTINSFLLSSPTYVQQNIYMINDYEIGPPFMYTIGESKIGGSSIPAGTTIRVNYTNNSESNKKFVANIEYLY